MARRKNESLKTFRFVVAGTRHEHRHRSIRMLNPGALVSLVFKPQNAYDKGAIAVSYRRRQLGWVPKALNPIIKGLKIREIRISEIGTGPEGEWTHLVLDVVYIPDERTKIIDQYGGSVAAILDLMAYKDVKVAREIARLPETDWQGAIEEWDSLQDHPEVPLEDTDEDDAR